MVQAGFLVPGMGMGIPIIIPPPPPPPPLPFSSLVIGADRSLISLLSTFRSPPFLNDSILFNNALGLVEGGADPEGGGGGGPFIFGGGGAPPLGGGGGLLAMSMSSLA